ncbi:MAG: hypothetical protein HOE45_02330 [Gammaproteobacteria bacterium]|nr:hypothetical protein [Gammaproteobacteria bacterium]
MFYHEGLEGTPLCQDSFSDLSNKAPGQKDPQGWMIICFQVPTVIGCAIEAHKTLGPGLLESTYQ